MHDSIKTSIPMRTSIESPIALDGMATSPSVRATPLIWSPLLGFHGFRVMCRTSALCSTRNLTAFQYPPTLDHDIPLRFQSFLKLRLWMTAKNIPGVFPWGVW